MKNQNRSFKTQYGKLFALALGALFVSAGASADVGCAEKAAAEAKTETSQKTYRAPASHAADIGTVGGYTNPRSPSDAPRWYKDTKEKNWERRRVYKVFREP